MTDTKMQRDAVDRFINATEQAKKALEGKYQRNFSGLGAAVRHAEERRDRLVRQSAAALHVLVDLRNVIQHSHVNKGLPIAVPREDAVEAMERIATLIERHPQIKDFMVQDPAVLSPNSPIEEASEQVVRLDLSQLPVCDDGSYVGLFTTNAMSRWLSNAIRGEGGTLIVENVTVAEILEHTEQHEEPKFVGPTQSALKACETLSKENAPPAILVTTDGTRAGQLQGLVTRFDVARILREATVTYP